MCYFFLSYYSDIIEVNKKMEMLKRITIFKGFTLIFSFRTIFYTNQVQPFKIDM